MATKLDPPLAEIAATRPVLEQIVNKWSVLILAVLYGWRKRLHRRQPDGQEHPRTQSRVSS